MLIVYNTTSRASFLQTDEWLKDIRAHADLNPLIANKADLVPEGEERGPRHEGEHSLVTFSTGD